MNVGMEILSYIVYGGDLQPFTDAGLNLAWLTDKADFSHDVVFTDDQASGAWRYILEYKEKHRRVPPREMFEASYPALRLPEKDWAASELIDLALERIRDYQLDEGLVAMRECQKDGDPGRAAEIMESVAKRLRNFRGTPDIEGDWDADIDVESRLTRHASPGIPLGIKELDGQFSGFQRGALVTYLGRGKAGKTSFMLLSAYNAWHVGRRVLFVTVEISAEVIKDKLDCQHAGIDIKRLQAGRLTPAEEGLYRDRRETMRDFDDCFRIIQPRAGGYTVSNLIDAVEKYHPDVVYVDGFYFMTDRETGRSGAHWEGHDNLARELKELAMDRDITVFTSMQLREKQLKSKGIDDSAMMGGTGLIMASDMVLGLDYDQDTATHTISCTRSRSGYLREVSGQWDWEISEFQVDTHAFLNP